MTRPTTKCRRCKLAYSDHEPPDRVCPVKPRIKGWVWLGHIHHGGSQSFTSDEVRWIDQVLRELRAGSDTRLLARSPSAATFARKVKTMREQINRARKATRESKSDT